MLTLAVYVARTLWLQGVQNKELDALHQAEDLISDQKVKVNGQVCLEYDRVVEYTDQVETEVKVDLDPSEPVPPIPVKAVLAKDNKLAELRKFVLNLIEQEHQGNWGDIPIEEKPLLLEARRWARVDTLTAACKLLGKKRASFP